MFRVPANAAAGKKITPYEVPSKPWEVAGVDIFIIHNQNLKGILEYYREFPAVQKVESMSAKDLKCATKVVFTEFGLLKILV